MRNILLQSATDIAQHFAFHSSNDSFVHQEDGMSDDALHDFVPGSVERDWPESSWCSRPVGTTGAPYEEILLQICSGEQYAYPVTFLVGDAGTGKSTAIAATLARLQTSGADASRPRIVVDFNRLPEPAPILGAKAERFPSAPPALFSADEFGSEPYDVDKVGNDPWLMLLDHLTAEVARIAGDAQLDSGQGLVAFWRWASQPSELVMFSPSTFNKYLGSRSGFVKVGNPAKLMSIRASILEDEVVEERVKYRLAELAFLGRGRNRGVVPGGVIVLDNLDPRPPTEQRAIAQFAPYIARALSAQVVIPVRPHTILSSTSGAMLGYYLAHLAPNPFAVLRRRFRRFSVRTGNKPSSVVAGLAIQDFAKRLSEDMPLTTFIAATVGDSSRFAIRNIHNLLVSRLLDVNPDDFRDRPFEPFSAYTAVPSGLSFVNKRRNSPIYEAYLCDSRTRQLNLRQFDNLFEVESTTLEYRRVVKMIILAYLSRLRGQCTTLRHLGRQLSMMWGIEVRLSIAAIREMSQKTRPLVWLRESVPFDAAMFETAGENIVHVSPLGLGYLREVATNPFYVKECAYSMPSMSARVGEKELVEVWAQVAESYRKEIESGADPLERQHPSQFSRTCTSRPIRGGAYVLTFAVPTSKQDEAPHGYLALCRHRHATTLRRRRSEVLGHQTQSGLGREWRHGRRDGGAGLAHGRC